MQKTSKNKRAKRTNTDLCKAALRSSLSIARGTHFIFGPVAGAAAVTALRLAHIENQALIALQQLATFVTIIVGNQGQSSGLTAALPPHLTLQSLLNKQRGSTVGSIGNTSSYRIMYHQHSQQQGQQPFPNGPRPPHRQPPPGQHPSHPNMQRMGFQFPRPTQLPDELESALSARGARDMDHRQIDHVNRPNQHQNQGPGPRMNQHGGFGANPMPLPPDNPAPLQQGVDWSSFQPPAKLFAGSQPNVNSQPQQHHGQLQQPLNIQTGARVPVWPPAVSNSMPAQTRHPHTGGEGQNLYTPESAGSILASFGLSNEDLEVLSHYPDDQLTPDTLPFILRDIQINKSSNQNPVASTSSSSHSVHDMAPPPSSSSTLAFPEVPSFLTVTQTAGKVIDYGHASRAKEGGETFKREPLSSERTVKMYPTLSSTSSATKVEKAERRHVRRETSDPTKHGDRDYRRIGAEPRKNTEFHISSKSRHQDRDYRHDRTKLQPSSESRSEASSRRSLSSSSGSKQHSGSKKLPTPTMISDFSAVSPKLYPHTCSLCNIQCDQEKEWVEHVNTVSHTASCRDLRNKYPGWRPDTPSRSRQHGSQTLWNSKDRSPSFSLSRSPSPSLSPGKLRMDGHTTRPHGRPSSPHRHPRQYHYAERRPRSEHHSGSHSPPHPHRLSSREQWLPRRGRLPSGGLPRSGLKRPHGDSSLSTHSSKHPPTKILKTVTKTGTKTTVKAPLVKKKKKVVTPASKDSSLFADRLVYLTGIPNDASEQEVTDLVCSFGKINNVILLPSSEEESEKALGQKASVCMMKVEDAQALSTSTNLSIREQIITACGAQKPEAGQPPDANNRKPEQQQDKKTAEANQKTSENRTVLISGLPDSGCSKSDVLDLFQTFETPSDIILATHLGKALVSVTDVEAVQELIKVHSFTPAKIKDTEVKLALIQQNIGLRTPVALYNLLMGSVHPLENPVRVNWSRLLVIQNVPDNPSGSNEVQKLVQRFGTVIKSLVLNSMVICEMATAAMALSVYKRFQMFPCIIDRNPLFFSRKPDPKTSTTTKVIAAYLEPPEDTPANSGQTAAAGEEETVPEETPAPPPEGLENGGDGNAKNESSTEATVETEASREVRNDDSEEVTLPDSSAEPAADVTTLPEETSSGETITEATCVDEGVCESEVANQEAPTKPETEPSASDTAAAPQETPGPPLPLMTQAMVNALLEECRIKTAKNTAAPSSGEQGETPMEIEPTKEAAEETNKGSTELPKKQERESKVKQVKKNPKMKEREGREKERRLWEKEERARREKERFEKARREREWREEERRERKRSSGASLPRSSSRSESHRLSSRRDERSKMKTETKMEEEEDEDEFPFNMSDFVTVDEVGEVADLPSIAVTTETSEAGDNAHTHPEDSSTQAETFPSEASESLLSDSAAGVSQHDSSPSQEVDPTCQAEASENPEAAEAPQNVEASENPEAAEAPQIVEASENPEGAEAPQSVEAPEDSVDPEADTTPLPDSTLSTPAAPAESSENNTVEKEGAEEEQEVLPNIPEEGGEKEKPSEDYDQMKDGAAEEEKDKRSEDTSNISKEENVKTTLKKEISKRISDSLPPFDPSSPVGLEFLIPKTGFFCKVCRRFFSGAKEAEINHCKTLKHYENLQKHLLTTKEADGISKMNSS